MPVISQSVTFKGKIHKDEDLSAIAHFTINSTPYLAIGSDESKKRVQLLKNSSGHTYEVDKDLEVELPTADDALEIDIESIAFDPDATCLYVMGSHSQKRSTVKVAEKTAAENRDRLTEISLESDRNQIFQVFLKPKSGKVKSIERIDNLKTVFAKDAYLKRFIEIPSKENGIDIEGLAFRDNQLFLGFRGPILRGNYVPVMVIPCTAFETEITEYEIRFVRLNGVAIRDMTAVEDGFLIIGGPMGDAPCPYGIYFWNGSDMVYGTDRPMPMPPEVVQLDEIVSPMGDDGSYGKPEGITVLEETATAYRVLIVFDSLKDGGPQMWHIHKP
ncbi:MAG: DUF3616 domain-containing protein [Cyanobacteria bacterium P01_D01_bin.156]